MTLNSFTHAPRHLPNMSKFSHWAVAILFCLTLILSSEGRANAQGMPSPLPCPQFFSTSGTPLSGGFLYAYVSGSYTPTATYTDYTLSTPNPYPVVLNAAGEPVSSSGSCGLWLSPSITYRFVLQNASAVQQWQIDGITTSNVNSIFSQANTWTANQTFSGGVTLTSPLTIPEIITSDVTGIIYIDGTVYPQSGVGIAAAISALGSGGGTIVLPCATYSITSTIVINTPIVFQGCGTGSTTTNGTRLIAASGTITPVIQVQGASASSRATDIYFRDMTIGSTTYTTSQNCMTIDHATLIDLRNVAFNNCGQAEWVDDAYQVGHHTVSYFQSGSGGSNTTATVRLENTSNPGTPSEEIYWDGQSIWQGGTQQGTAVYMGPATEEIRIIGDKLDYGNGTANPIIYMYQTQIVNITANTINGYEDTCSGGPGVVYLEGTSGTRTQMVTIAGNQIAFGNGCPGISVDYANAFTFADNTFLGAGSGTAIDISANAQAGKINGIQMFSSDTPITDTAGLSSIIYGDVSLGATIIPKPLELKRTWYDQATALTSAAFTINSGWGTSPSISAIQGYDSAFVMAITAGSGSPSSNPTITWTYADGHWPSGNPPACTVTRGDANSPTTGWWAIATSTTTATLTFVGTPTASDAYLISVTCGGK